MQTAPLTPHWPLLSDAEGTQVPPTVVVQQPPAQVVESQTHWPEALQCWLEVQAAQSAPAAPHWPFVSEPYATHEPPSVAVQQPLAQEVESQTH